MEQVENINYDNGNIISEDEANDIYFLGSMENKYGSMSMPQVDEFDVAGNKEPTLGETIAEGVKTVGTAINDQDTTLGKIGEDTIKGMLKGSDKGGSNALTGIAETFGAVVDGVNDYVVKPVLNEFGIEGSKRPFGGTEMNVEAVNKITSVLNDLIPSFLKEPINEFANEPFNYETYGTIVEEVSKFGITAVPAAKIVGMMSSANAIVRGFAWGGIADYMSMNPEDPAIATFLVDYFKTDRDKLEPWARNAISVLEKHDTDGVITKRLKNMMEGTIAGGIAEGILPLVKGIIKATSIVPWAKTVTPLVGGAGVTFSDDAEGSVFSSIVKGAAKEVLPNTVAKNADNVMQVDSLKQSNNQAGKDFDAANARYFQDGNYEAPTAENPISIVTPTKTDSGIIAFHGSGADFNEFKLSKIGTGEGAQVYGNGLYFTDSKDIAKFYKDALSDSMAETRFVFDGTTYERGSPEWKMLSLIKNKSISSAKNLVKILESDLADGKPYVTADSIKRYKNILDQAPKKSDIKMEQGRIYEVNIKTVTDDLLNFDAPLSEQSETVKKAIVSLGMNISPKTKGSQIYEQIGSVLSEPPFDNRLSNTTNSVTSKKVSEKLNSLGIKGIRYKAGQLSVKDSDATNYVIFDDKIIDIMKKYGIVGAVGVTAANSNEAESNT